MYSQTINQIMKKILCIAALLFGAVYVNAQTATPANPVNPKAPVAKWEATTIDLGEIEQGIPKEAQFKVKNMGKEPLIIERANASCGCTNLKYEKEPIMPKKTGIVAATYNAASVSPFNKTITVKTNADEAAVVLTIKGTVVPKK